MRRSEQGNCMFIGWIRPPVDLPSVEVKDVLNLAGNAAVLAGECMQ